MPPLFPSYTAASWNPCRFSPNLADIEPSESASVPGVIDLLSRRPKNTPSHQDDLDDVFDRYYTAQSDDSGFGLLDD